MNPLFKKIALLTVSFLAVMLFSCNTEPKAFLDFSDDYCGEQREIVIRHVQRIAKLGKMGVRILPDTTRDGAIIIGPNAMIVRDSLLNRIKNWRETNGEYAQKKDQLTLRSELERNTFNQLRSSSVTDYRNNGYLIEIKAKNPSSENPVSSFDVTYWNYVKRKTMLRDLRNIGFSTKELSQE